MIKSLLKKYSDELLFDEICLGFELDKILHLNKEKMYNFNLYKEYILSKIELLKKQCDYIIVEKEYTESVWKEIYSLHYAHTSYSNNNKVMRIHFFTEKITLFNDSRDNINYLSNSYLGYITLRPVPDFNLMLSFIVPNWDVLQFEKDNYLMTCKQTVHIAPYAIKINTFPFYSQDSIVTTCAQADIIMFATYTNRRYNHKLIKVSDIQEFMKYSPLPSKGLKGKEILEIFRSNGSPVDYHLKKKIKRRGASKKQIYLEGVSYNESLKHITNILDSYVESGLPVIVYNAKHVVLIIGHTNENPKKYIVYDDSGVFLQNAVNNNSFIGAVTNRKLFPRNNDTTYLICATHSRVYLTADEYNGFVNEFIPNLNLEYRIGKKRNIIVDNVDLKAHLSKLLNTNIIDTESQKAVINFINKDLPHYLWYTELHLGDNSMIILIGETTYPVNTHLNIFKLVLWIPCKYQLKLLTHITKKEENYG